MREDMPIEILDGYDDAVITLLWCIHQAKRKLIFASVELYPRECVEFYEMDEQSVQLRVGNSQPRPRMFYCRIRMKADKALELYTACAHTGRFDMTWETEKAKDGNSKYIISSQMQQMPAWPFLTVSKNDGNELCPYLPRSGEVYRVHHLLAKDPDGFVMQLASHQKSIEWIQKRLLWNLSEYPELIGSMHLILPNPVYRYMEEELIPSEKDKPEQVRIKFALRKGQSMDGLRLLTVERTSLGIVNFQEKDVCDSTMAVTLAGKAEEFATVVYSKKYGLLDYTGFGSFLRGICVNLGIVNAIRKVNLPNSDEFYQVPLTEDDVIKIGDELQENTMELGRKLMLRAWKKDREKSAEELGQHLFSNNTKKEAEAFIAEIIKSARKHVVIIDPYFATMDLYKYIFRISSRTVKIEIITSSEALNDKDELSPCTEKKQMKKGEVLLREIEAYGEQISDEGISVRVMTGTPLIHDRFLVIDDEVWFSGNSLNHIGERASMIMRLPDPSVILSLIKDVQKNKDRVKTLKEWAKNCESDGECNGQ